MRLIHYRPEDGALCDVIPFFWQGKYHLFYLQDYRNPEQCGEGTSWRQIVTSDFVHFEEWGEALPRGAKDEQDLYVFTGSVIRAQGRFHIFYTGHNPHFSERGKPQEAVCHAVSDDLKRWEKLPEDTFFAPAGYEKEDWRDPFVFYDEQDGRYHMLLAARKAVGPAVRRGVTAHCTSADLKSWAIQKPLWDPELYHTHECPDLFRMGGWVYLLFSEYSGSNQTRYVKSRSVYGPWEAPVEDIFDARAFYAAKTASDGRKRYLFGWIPTREQDRDENGFSWGGNLCVHELWQDERGDLHVRMPDSIRDEFSVEQPFSWNGEQDERKQETRLSRREGFSQLCAARELPARCLLSLQLSLDELPQLFGLRLRWNGEKDFSYGLLFEPSRQQVRVSMYPNPPWFRMDTNGLSRRLPMKAGERLCLEVLLEGDIAVLYVNDSAALSFRMCGEACGGAALFVAQGALSVCDCRLFVPQGTENSGTC